MLLKIDLIIHLGEYVHFLSSHALDSLLWVMIPVTSLSIKNHWLIPSFLDSHRSSIRMGSYSKRWNGPSVFLSPSPSSSLIYTFSFPKNIDMSPRKPQIPPPQIPRIRSPSRPRSSLNPSSRFTWSRKREEGDCYCFRSWTEEWSTYLCWLF